MFRCPVISWGGVLDGGIRLEPSQRRRHGHELGHGIRAKLANIRTSLGTLHGTAAFAPRVLRPEAAIAGAALLSRTGSSVFSQSVVCNRSTLLQHADEIEHVLRFPHAERRGGLVHDDHVGIPAQRPADRHRLTLAAGQLFDGCVHVRQTDAETIEVSARLVSHRTLVEALQSEESALELGAHEDVLVDRHARREAEVLVDGGDPGLQSLLG